MRCLKITNKVTYNSKKGENSKALKKFFQDISPFDLNTSSRQNIMVNLLS
jgi:hypothetical protein